MTNLQTLTSAIRLLDLDALKEVRVETADLVDLIDEIARLKVVNTKLKENNYFLKAQCNSAKAQCNSAKADYFKLAAREIPKLNKLA